jgi:hypothetical protein
MWARSVPTLTFEAACPARLRADTRNCNPALRQSGGFSFYPWLDVSQTRCGIVARKDELQIGEWAGTGSVRSGRLIRKAWVSVWRSDVNLGDPVMERDAT